MVVGWQWWLWSCYSGGWHETESVRDGNDGKEEYFERRGLIGDGDELWRVNGVAPRDTFCSPMRITFRYPGMSVLLPQI